MDIKEGLKNLKKKSYFFLLGFFLELLTIISLFWIGNINLVSFITNVRLVVFFTLLILLLMTCLSYFWEKDIKKVEKKIHEKKGKKPQYYCILVGGIYMISLIWIIVAQTKQIYWCWMLAPLVLSMVSSPISGGGIFLVCQRMLGITLEQEVEMFVYEFVFGIGLCFLVPYLKKVSNMGYVFVISIVCNALLLLLKMELSVKKICTFQTIWSEFSIFLVLLCSIGIYWMYKGYVETGKFLFVKADIQEFFSTKEFGWEEGKRVKICDLEEITEEEAQLRSLTETDSTLQILLKKKLPGVYNHSTKVAELSKKAAEFIGVDTMLCYAGGLYHEIGKLEGKNYVQKGYEIGISYHFPNELLDVIQEHNVKWKIPVSKEATIVMMADSVVTMLEYMELTEKYQNKNKTEIIRSIIKMRLEKGYLKESCISIKEYEQLLQFFGDIVNTKEKENDISF